MTPETAVTIRRAVLAGDGAGGYTTSRTDDLAENVPASFRLKSTRGGLMRREQGVGVQVQEERVCVIYGYESLDVQQNDTVFDQETQVSWLALNDGRRYPHSYQIDVRRMS